MQRLWLVRLGKNGEFEADALSRSRLSIGFNVTEDLAAASDREAVLGIIRTIFPDSKPGRQANFAAQEPICQHDGGRRYCRFPA
jgi:restriction system protein